MSLLRIIADKYGKVADAPKRGGMTDMYGNGKEHRK